jgi:hypothetical protein
VLGNDAAPPIGTKLDRADESQPCEYMLGQGRENSRIGWLASRGRSFKAAW